MMSKSEELSLSLIDYKTMGNVHNGVLLSHKEGQHYIIYREIDGTGEYYAK